jgi:carboxymethylenebutenolidase
VGDWIELDNGARAWRALPASVEGSGVLLVHAWWGLNATIRAYADRLADAGFVVVAPDLYGGIVVDSVAAAEVEVGREPAAKRLPIVIAGLDRLRSMPGVRRPGLGVIGFSMGAYFAIEAAAADSAIAAVILNYGTGEIAEGRSGRAAFQGHFAADDPYELAEYIDALEASLRAAGRDTEFHRYPGTHHWFLEPDRPEYDPAAAAMAWDRTLAFLRDRLSPDWTLSRGCLRGRQTMVDVPVAAQPEPDP